MTKLDWGMKGVIDRRENDLVVVKLDDGQEINWPIAHLPHDWSEGMVVQLSLRTEALAKEERTALAKAMLNEILKADDR